MRFSHQKEKEKKNEDKNLNYLLATIRFLTRTRWLPGARHPPRSIAWKQTASIKWALLKGTVYSTKTWYLPRTRAEAWRKRSRRSYREMNYFHDALLERARPLWETVQSLIIPLLGLGEMDRRSRSITTVTREISILFVYILYCCCCYSTRLIESSTWPLAWELGTWENDCCCLTAEIPRRYAHHLSAPYWDGNGQNDVSFQYLAIRFWTNIDRSTAVSFRQGPSFPFLVNSEFVCGYWIIERPTFR